MPKPDQGWLPIYRREGYDMAMSPGIRPAGAGKRRHERASAIDAEHIQPKPNPAPPLNVMTDGVRCCGGCRLRSPVERAWWRDLANMRWAGFQRPETPSPTSTWRCGGDDRRLGCAGAAPRRSRGAARARQASAGPVVPAICRAARAFADKMIANAPKYWSRFARGRAHRRQPRAVRNDRGHPADRADEERRSRRGPRLARPPPASPAVTARRALARGGVRGD